MQIHETHTAAKSASSQIEDLIFASDHLIAVVDGASDKTGLRIHHDGRDITSGRYAAELIVDALAHLNPGTAPPAAVVRISERLEEGFQANIGGGPERRPSASAVVADLENNIIWRVGDCGFRTGDTAYMGSLPTDRIAAAFRAAYLATFTPEELAAADSDPGRDAILPLLRRQGRLANRTGEFGYGVLDGQEVPAEFIEVYPLEPGDTILASDGYPTLPATLTEAEAEADLARLLEEDPLCVGPLRALRGLEAGQDSFDDRAWIRFRT